MGASAFKESLQRVWNPILGTNSAVSVSNSVEILFQSTHAGFRNPIMLWRDGEKILMSLFVIITFILSLYFDCGCGPF